MVIKVTVVIPTYDSAGYLPATLDSIIDQNHPDLKIILVDDGSTDDTPRVAASYLPHVHYIREKHSGGPSHPRNVGVRAGGGDYIAFFDSDDLMEPGAVADSMAVFAAHPEVDLVFANSRSIDARGKVVNPDYLAEYRDFRRIMKPTDDPDVGLLSGPRLHSELIRANFIGTCGVIARKQALLDVGLFDEELKNGDDRDMWLRMALTLHTFAFVDRVHFSYRKHDASVTNRGWRRMPSVIRLLEKQLPFVYSDRDRRFLEKRINRARISLAYGLRREGLLDEAAAGYREAVKRRVSMTGLIGMAKTAILKRTGH